VGFEQRQSSGQPAYNVILTGQFASVGGWQERSDPCFNLGANLGNPRRRRFNGAPKDGFEQATSLTSKFRVSRL
jgi:hypothetical protein